MVRRRGRGGTEGKRGEEGRGRGRGQGGEGQDGRTVWRGGEREQGGDAKRLDGRHEIGSHNSAERVESALESDATSSVYVLMREHSYLAIVTYTRIWQCGGSVGLTSAQRGEESQGKNERAGW